MLPFQRPLIPRTGDAVSGTELGFIALGKMPEMLLFMMLLFMISIASCRRKLQPSYYL